MKANFFDWWGYISIVFSIEHYLSRGNIEYIFRHLLVYITPDKQGRSPINEHIPTIHNNFCRRLIYCLEESRKVIEKINY